MRPPIHLIEVIIIAAGAAASLYARDATPAIVALLLANFNATVRAVSHARAAATSAANLAERVAELVAAITGERP